MRGFCLVFLFIAASASGVFASVICLSNGGCISDGSTYPYCPECRVTTPTITPTPTPAVTPSPPITPTPKPTVTSTPEPPITPPAPTPPAPIPPSGQPVTSQDLKNNYPIQPPPGFIPGSTPPWPKNDLLGKGILDSVEITFKQWEEEKALKEKEIRIEKARRKVEYCRMNRDRLLWNQTEAQRWVEDALMTERAAESKIEDSEQKAELAAKNAAAAEQAAGEALNKAKEANEGGPEKEAALKDWAQKDLEAKKLRKEAEEAAERAKLIREKNEPSLGGTKGAMNFREEVTKKLDQAEKEYQEAKEEYEKLSGEKT